MNHIILIKGDIYPTDQALQAIWKLCRENSIKMGTDTVAGGIWIQIQEYELCTLEFKEALSAMLKTFTDLKITVETVEAN